MACATGRVIACGSVTELNELNVLFNVYPANKSKHVQLCCTRGKAAVENVCVYDSETGQKQRVLDRVLDSRSNRLRSRNGG